MADLQRVARLVSARTGLSFPESRWSIAETAMRNSQRQSGARKISDYLELLESTESAFEHLVNELTVGETYFFRDPAQFEFISQEVLPRAGARGGRFRAWGAGCATGEEPFSIAILLDQLGQAAKGSVVGTDIAGARLAHARRGIYSRWSLRGCPDSIVDTYFEKVARRFRLAPHIQSAVEFSELNLGAPHFRDRRSDLRELDLVLCRNVLIYFSPDAIERVARNLLDTLSADGWLLLGASDPPLQDLVPCEVEVTDAGFAYQRRRAKRHERTPAAPVSPNVSPADTRPAPNREGRRFWTAKQVPLTRSVLRRKSASIRRALATFSASLVTADEAACISALRQLLNRGKLQESEDAFVTALREHPESAELAYLHALYLSEVGRHAEAARAARTALYLDRRFSVAHLALGRALAGTGDLSGAERALRNGVTSLAALPAEAVVPGSDGETASTLLELVRARMRLLAAGGT